MIVGAYSLDLYCDKENPNHIFDEFPHQFVAQTQRTCRKLARNKGWKFRKDEAYCPTCTNEKGSKENR